MDYSDHRHGLYSSTPVDLELSAATFAAYARPAQDVYSTSMAYDATTLYADAPYAYGSRSPPAIYPEDGEMHVPSSNLSTASATSSNVGSPLSHHDQLTVNPEWAVQQGFMTSPGIVDHHSDYFPNGTEYSFAQSMETYAPQYEFVQAKGPGFVDPSLIQPEMSRPLALPGYDGPYTHPLQQYPASPALSTSPQVRNGSTSPFVVNHSYQQYSPYTVPMDPQSRRVSFHSACSGEPQCSGDEIKEKTRCPDCQKTFKDLKAHMLTHQQERPEKCPMKSCEYHIKGFARKYDKNRHTLTHYKGTMICGFCSGSGSATEKSFNRADVFKRHLTAVHAVEQTPPNSRKKANGVGNNKVQQSYPADATGKCSTCTATFSNAQDFYEHLDDCVLRIVQQEDPAEAINARRLAEVENDREVYDTLEKNQLPTSTMTFNTEEDDDEMADESDDDVNSGKASPTKKSSSANGVQKSRGLTRSRGGVPLPSRNRGRKARKDYPSSWGFDKGQMTTKKRVMAVFDGPRRLAKDDMMLRTDHEVRLNLSDGKSYVTDLDVATMARAEGFHGATDEEKGPWISDELCAGEMQNMLLEGGNHISS